MVHPTRHAERAKQPPQSVDVQLDHFDRVNRDWHVLRVSRRPCVARIAHAAAISDADALGTVQKSLVPRGVAGHARIFSVVALKEFGDIVAL